MFVWFCYTYWLVFIFCGMKDVWAFGLMFPAFYPFLDWALLRQRPSFFSRPHVFLSCIYPLLRLWAYWLLILSYHFIMSALTLPSFLLRVTPWTCSLVFLLCQPTSSSISCSGLPRPIFHIFTSFGLCWATFLLCQPILLLYSLAHLLPPYLFNSHWLFTRFFGLPGPITYLYLLHLYLLLLFRLIGL